MSLRLALFVAVVIIASAFAQARGAENTITLRDGSGLSGKIVKQDENGVTLQTGTASKVYRWEELQPKCAYELMRRAVDPNSASAHFALAGYCMATGLIEEAKAEFLKCLELDPSYAEKVKQTLDSLGVGAPGAGGAKPSATPKEGGEKGAAKTPPAEEPVVNQEEVLARQRQNGKKVNERIGTELKTSETEHFIIHSDFTNAADMAQIRKWCETLYDRLSEVLDVKPGDRLWNGKCEIYLFLSRAKFVRFAQVFDNFAEAKLSGGYFLSKGRDCHIVIPRTEYQASDRGVQKDIFLYTLLHEGSHAFLQLHGNVVDLSAWLHEGFAQHFELALPKGSAPARESRIRLVKSLTAKPGFTRFNELRALERLLGNDREGYALSWSIVDYMINADRASGKGKFGEKRFAKFVALLKAGKTEEEAMKAAYGQTPEQLEEGWLRNVRSTR